MTQALDYAVSRKVESLGQLETLAYGCDIQYVDDLIHQFGGEASPDPPHPELLMGKGKNRLLARLADRRPFTTDPHREISVPAVTDRPGNRAVNVAGATHFRSGQKARCLLGIARREIQHLDPGSQREVVQCLSHVRGSRQAKTIEINVTAAPPTCPGFHEPSCNVRAVSGLWKMNSESLLHQPGHHR